MRLSFILFFFSLVNSIHCYGAYSVPKIKVKINSSMKSVFITGTDMIRENYLEKAKKSFSGRKLVKFNCRQFDKLKGMKGRFKKPILLASLKSMTGLLSVKGGRNESEKKYNGELHILTSPNGNSCDVVNELSIENYISTLLSKEMNGSWPLEVLKAQAIAARTYAIYKMQKQQISKIKGYNTYYHIESSEKHQVSGEFFDSTPNTIEATKITKGEVLLTKVGKMTPVFFHAHCGGQTLTPDLVWKNKVDGYKSVKCPYCDRGGKGPWVKSFSMKRFLKFLNWGRKKKYISGTGTVDKVLSFRFVPDKKYKKWLRFYINEELVIIKKPLFRRYFGRILLPSNNFKLAYDNGRKSFSVKGQGLGHGVGMCQLGALDFAKKGHNYKGILHHYFPGHILHKIY